MILWAFEKFRGLRCNVVLQIKNRKKINIIKGFGYKRKVLKGFFNSILTHYFVATPARMQLSSNMSC